MHKKAIFVLLVLTLLTFFNCLFNGFVGDDEFLFIKNPYFHSFSNFSKIFTDDYIADQDAIFNDQAQDINSGSVAYRPVLSATFFMDYWLWKARAFGYHLTNVVIHLINVLLVYFLFFLILKKGPAAFLGALIFAVHPLKSEPVASIGYRADILAAMFVLLAFLSYLKSKEKGGAYHLCSHLFFLLAVFSKESAVVFPGLVMAYDWLLERRRLGSVVKGLFSRYAGFVALLAFYLFVYIKVFPNSSLGTGKPLEGGLWAQGVLVLRIFSHYLSVFFLPFLVKALPPLYTPSIGYLWGIKTWAAVAVVILFFVLLARGITRNKNRGFFLLWFLICFIPVSNIILIANPMAYRFMYLPSLGLCGFAAVLLMKLKEHDIFRKNDKLIKIILIGIIILCMSTTVFLNFNWRDNVMMALAMVNDFPEYPVGYLHAGMAYFNAGQIEKAEDLLQRGFEVGLSDPRAFYLMGLCVVDDLDRSKVYFKKSIEAFPRFVYSHIGLGRAYLLEDDIEKAQVFFKRSVELAPQWKGYGYLLQIHLMRGEETLAEAVLKLAKEELKGNESAFLERFYQKIKRGDVELPADLGI